MAKSNFTKRMRRGTKAIEREETLARENAEINEWYEALAKEAADDVNSDEVQQELEAFLNSADRCTAIDLEEDAREAYDEFLCDDDEFEREREMGWCWDPTCP